MTEDLEMQVAKPSRALLAECCSGTALQLDRAQRSRLRSEDLSRSAGFKRTMSVNSCQLKDRKLQQVLLEKSEVLTSLGLPSLIILTMASVPPSSTQLHVV